MRITSNLHTILFVALFSLSLMPSTLQAQIMLHTPNAGSEFNPQKKSAEQLRKDMKVAAGNEYKNTMVTICYLS